MMFVFMFGVSACEAKDVPKAHEVKQEVKAPDQDAQVPNTSPIPQKKAPAPEPKKSLVVFESSTDGVFIIKVYADNKEILTDALSYDQLAPQLAKTLEVLYKKKEVK